MSTKTLMAAQALPQAGAPILPTRSSLRKPASMQLLSVKTQVQPTARLSQAVPHEVYLSSEEDASSSADDFSYSDLESDDASVPDSPERKRSHEVTARAVSVIYAGKPSIVHMPARSCSPASSMGSPVTPSLLRTPTESMLDTRRRLSISSTMTFAKRLPRTSTMGANQSEVTLPPFLSIDPYATKDATDRPSTPKTPSGMFKRTLSLVKKRSRSHLKHQSVYSQDNASVATLPAEGFSSPMAQSPASPMSYQDIMRSARTRSQYEVPEPSPVSKGAESPTKSRLRSGLSMARRRSIKS